MPSVTPKLGKILLPFGKILRAKPFKFCMFV